MDLLKKIPLEILSPEAHNIILLNELKLDLTKLKNKLDIMNTSIYDRNYCSSFVSFFASINTLLIMPISKSKQIIIDNFVTSLDIFLFHMGTEHETEKILKTAKTIQSNITASNYITISRIYEYNRRKIIKYENELFEAKKQQLLKSYDVPLFLPYSDIEPLICSELMNPDLSLPSILTQDELQKYIIEP